MHSTPPVSPDRLDDLTEQYIALLYSDVGDVDCWATKALRKRIRALVAQEVEAALTQAYGDGADNVGMIA